MHTYEFIIALHAEPDLDAVDRLYAFFGESGVGAEGVEDFTLITSSGTAAIDCTVQATTFDEALHFVLPKLLQEGIRVVGVEVNETGLALLQEAV